MTKLSVEKIHAVRLKLEEKYTHVTYVKVEKVENDYKIHWIVGENMEKLVTFYSWNVENTFNELSILGDKDNYLINDLEKEFLDYCEMENIHFEAYGANDHSEYIVKGRRYDVWIYFSNEQDFVELSTCNKWKLKVEQKKDRLERDTEKAYGNNIQRKSVKAIINNMNKWLVA